MSESNGEVLTMNGHPNNLLTLCLASFIDDQKEWSEQPAPNGFGPGDRREGVCKHIESELGEIRKAKPGSLELLIEWCDVVILALDGAWRSGFSSVMICEALLLKTQINHRRKWPAAPPDQPSMHVKGAGGLYSSELLTTVAGLLKEGKISAGRATEMLGVSRWDLPDIMAPFNIPSATLQEDDLKPIPALGRKIPIPPEGEEPPAPEPLSDRDLQWMGHTCYLIYWHHGDSCQEAPTMDHVRDILFHGAATEWDCDIPSNVTTRRELIKFTNIGSQGAVMAQLDCSKLFPEPVKENPGSPEPHKLYDPLPPEPGTGPDWWCGNCTWCNSDLRKSCRKCHVNRVQNGVDTSHPQQPPPKIVEGTVCINCGTALSRSGISRTDSNRCKACTDKREE